jgi:hypothetical protein
VFIHLIINTSAGWSYKRESGMEKNVVEVKIFEKDSIIDIYSLEDEIGRSGTFECRNRSESRQRSFLWWLGSAVEMPNNPLMRGSRG